MECPDINEENVLVPETALASGRIPSSGVSNVTEDSASLSCLLLCYNARFF